ncbi:sushi domain-containing protein 3-like isoform X1 [Corvus hawaiiensis]|uniref:sushi domain-containing protein 3-like isoform X1 n=1 Tax=Corvus hawaiiensis TaxID=134902 RepID=UPI002019AC83|nr:sushi domain-containing protein 3-like isoform X1 [Corvus hawaiiensis]
MTGQRFGKCIILCLLPWSCLSFAWSDAAGPGTASLGAGHIRKGLPRDVANGTDVHSNISVPCTALPPPRYGYYYVEGGSGVSLGSVLVYWCQEGYQLVGSERLACLRQESTSSWSHPPPQCQAAPQPSDTGSRVAVAASLLSGAVILALSVSFAVCCWRDRARKSRAGQQHRRKGRGRKRDPSAPEGGRNAFGRLKHYHRRDYHLSALSSSVFPGAFAGCNNLAFQSSPDQQPKLPLGRWRPGAEAVPRPLPPGPGPASGLPGHLPGHLARSALLPARPHRDLLPRYCSGVEEHKGFSECGKPL